METPKTRRHSPAIVRPWGVVLPPSELLLAAPGRPRQLWLRSASNRHPERAAIAAHANDFIYLNGVPIRQLPMVLGMCSFFISSFVIRHVPVPPIPALVAVLSLGPIVFVATTRLFRRASRGGIVVEDDSSLGTLLDLAVDHPTIGGLVKIAAEQPDLAPQVLVLAERIIAVENAAAHTGHLHEFVPALSTLVENSQTGEHDIAASMAALDPLEQDVFLLQRAREELTAAVNAPLDAAPGEEAASARARAEAAILSVHQRVTLEAEASQAAAERLRDL